MKTIKILLLLLLVAHTAFGQTLSEGFEAGSMTAISTPAGTIASYSWNLTSSTTAGFGNWAVVNVTGPSVTWAQGNNSAAQPARTGTHAAYLNKENVATGTVAEDWLITPKVDLSLLTDPALKFYSRLTSNSNTQPSNYKVLIYDADQYSQTDISAAANINNGDSEYVGQWTEAEINPVQQEYTEITVNIPSAYYGKEVYFAFIMTGDDGDRWLIDDVLIDSSCLMPANINVLTTASSAQFTWDTSGSATQWEVILIPSGATLPGSGTTVTSASYNATSLTGGGVLQPGTNYTFYVRSICGTSNVSSWKSIPFWTKHLGEDCGSPIVIPSALPYIKTGNSFTNPTSAYDGNPGASNGCGLNSQDFFETGYQKVYSFTPSANMSINIKLDANNNKTGIFIYDDCNDIGVNCLAGNGSFELPTKEINGFNVTSGNTYYIVVATTLTLQDISSLLYTLTLSQNNCPGNIAANFNISAACPNPNTYSAVANITSLGSSSSLVATAYTAAGSFLSTQNVSVAGTVTFGPYNSADKVQIVLQSQQYPNCFLVSSILSTELCGPVNDECENAIVLQPIQPADNYNGVNGYLFNATASSQAGSCAGADDDIWYEFVATNTTHYIAITNINGYYDIDHALYSGSQCSTGLTQLYCSSEYYSTAENLVIGETYKIRVFSHGNSNVNSQFAVNTIAFTPSCIDTNPNSEVVKQLFVNLINHLISVSDLISEAPAPYECPELTALADYITDPNPKIYNFTKAETVDQNGTYMMFNFADHGTSDYDVTIYIAPNSPYFSDVNLEPYTSAETTSNLFPSDTDAAEYLATQNLINKRLVTVRHINFCPVVFPPPPPPCNDGIVGNIGLSEGVSCIVQGQSIGFVFVTETTNITQYTWAIHNYDGDVIFTSHDTSPSYTFESEDYYFMEVTVTTADGCTQKIQKGISVLPECNLCAEQDPLSQTVKNLYIALINKLLTLYQVTPENPNPSVTSPYNCPELVALSPYLTDANAQIYNINYNTSTNVLSFSFGNHTGYDVTVKDMGAPVTDIDLINFSSPDTSSYMSTLYANSTYAGGHSVKHVKFCPSANPQCPPLSGSIEMSSGLSCVSLGTTPDFYFYTDATTVNTYNWTFYDLDGITPLVTATPTSSHAGYQYTVAGNYIIKLDVTYNNGCTATFEKSITVSSTPCTDFCTETNDTAGEIKNLYKAVLNYVLMAYYTNGSIPNGTTLQQLTQLAPYINDPDPKFYNVIFDHQNNIVKFSFGNHGTSNDVILTLPGTPYAFITDVNLMSYDAENADLQSLITIFANSTTTTTSSHQVRHLNFCPGVECAHLFGEIVFEGGISCVIPGEQYEFKLLANSSEIETYLWTFYYPNGLEITTSSLEQPTMTYHNEGTYTINLTVTEDTGCKSTYTKIITVDLDCPPVTGDPEPPSTVCTEVNELAPSIRSMFISLLNHLLNLDTPPADDYVCDELNQLAPYINGDNPRIYDAHYTGQTFSFSFTDNQTQPDVVIKDFGYVTDVNLYNFSSEASYTTITVGYSDGTAEAASVKNIDFCPPPPPCYSHIAFVIDESGSISTDEANRIKTQLYAFLQQQAGVGGTPGVGPTHTAVSFIGMSDSDADERTDHVYGIINGTGDLAPFEQWLDNYKKPYTNAGLAHGISPNSDYWASGLKRAMRTDLYPNPDLVVIITDGSQTDNLNGLKELIAEVNQFSHLYVYGIGTGHYVDLDPLSEDANDPDAPISEVSGHLMLSLKYLLELPVAEFPISDQVHLLAGDYFEYPDFNHLATDLRYFSDKIYLAELGCGGEAIPKDICNDCQTFQPSPGQDYWLSAWVMVEQNIQVKEYTTASIRLLFEDAAGIVWGYPTGLILSPSGNIIDGWQRIAAKFTVPPQASIMKMELLNNSPNLPAYFDDIRVYPVNGSMKSYVYDPETFRLMAELDDNNYSTFYEYDKEGSLIRVKKETSEGVKTIQETRSGNVIQPIPTGGQ